MNNIKKIKTEKMNDNNLKPAEVFDTFRKDYQHRHEFSRYRIKLSNNQKEEAKILAGLGFQVSDIGPE